MTDLDLLYAGAAAQAELIRTGRVRPSELVAASLTRIRQVDGPLRAVSALRADAAAAQARVADDEAAAIAAGGAAAQAAAERDRPLLGIPVAIKEEVAVAGMATTFGGRANPIAAGEDAEVVRRLTAAGAIVVAKTHMPEFGQFPSTEGDWGRTLNPWDLTRSPGGSSGGSAVAVAAGMVPVAIGGDGGGSIRIPASACGLFGLKPQRGRVSTAPHPDLWGILGTAGPLTRSALDSALVYDVIRGTTPADRFHAPEPGGRYVDAARTDPGPLRVRWTTEALVPGFAPSPVVAAAVVRMAGWLTDLGHDVAPIRLAVPPNPWPFPVLFYAALAEEQHRVQRPDLLERRTRETIAIARYAATPALVAAAERRAKTLAAFAESVFGGCDVLLMPVQPERPARAGFLSGKGSLAATLASSGPVSYTALWNLTGHPAASVPVGAPRPGRLPESVQFVAGTGREDVLFALAGQVERAHPWAHVRPALAL